jgi:uncharacterized membrane protein
LKKNLNKKDKNKALKKMKNIFATALSEKKRFRSKSMPLIRNKDFEKEFNEEFIEIKEKSFCEKTNDALLKYKELKKFYKLTKIPPVYVLSLLAIILAVVLIILFNKNLSLSLATIPPLFMTFKTLQHYDHKDLERKKEVIHWLKYWIFYGILLNFESWFSFFLKEFYTFLKIIAVLTCFPVESSLLDWIYSIILNFFNENESIILNFFRNIWEHLIGENNENNEEGNNNNIAGFINDKINVGQRAFNVLRNLV